jgi:hypothetical protein
MSIKVGLELEEVGVAMLESMVLEYPCPQSFNNFL